MRQASPSFLNASIFTEPHGAVHKMEIKIVPSRRQENSLPNYKTHCTNTFIISRFQKTQAPKLKTQTQNHRKRHKIKDIALKS